MSINERIKLIVDLHYGSQAELANDLGVSRVAISGYINSERKPNTEVYEKFYTLGYNLNWLVSGIGSVKRRLLNVEELDQYDKYIFGVSTIEAITTDGSLKHRTMTDESYLESLTSQTKELFYQQRALDGIDLKIDRSFFTKEIKVSLEPCNPSWPDKKTKSKLIELIEKGVSLENHIPIKLKINNSIELDLFNKYLSSYLFLMTEFVYFKNSISERNTSNPIGQIAKTNHETYSLHKPLISFDELKERFILLSELIDNKSYIESKSILFISMIDKIFKIEQAK